MSYWYDSKASNENSRSVREDSRSRPYDSWEYDETSARGRQPLAEKNGGRSKSPIGQSQLKTRYDPSHIGIENDYFKPLDEDSRLSRGVASQSDRYEKRVRGREENSQKGELRTPSPSPSRSPPQRDYGYGANPEYDENQGYDGVEPGEIQEPYGQMGDPYQGHGMQGFPQQRGRPQQFGGNFQNPMAKRPTSNRFLRPTNKIPKPPKSSAADWTCTGCKNINFARRISCNICNMPKPYFEILKTPISQLGPQGLFKDTDWQCFNCRNVNFQKRAFCNVCQEPKPEEYIVREMMPAKKKKNKKKKKKSANTSQIQVQPNPYLQPNFGINLIEMRILSV